MIDAGPFFGCAYILSTLTEAIGVNNSSDVLRIARLEVWTIVCFKRQ